jgi:hypothetical protein
MHRCGSTKSAFFRGRGHRIPIAVHYTLELVTAAPSLLRRVPLAICHFALRVEGIARFVSRALSLVILTPFAAYGLLFIRIGALRR